MTKILIVSDSHGQTTELEQIKALHENEVECMIHCGDSELQATDKAISGFLTVRGNCDYDAGYPHDIIHEISGYRIFITHGHKYSVKSSLMNLTYKAIEQNANIVCFGHSHILGAEQVQGMLLINPGSLRLPRLRKERTYILLELDENIAIVKIYELGKGELVDLRQTFTMKMNK